MNIPKEKQEYLLKLGYSESQLGEISQIAETLQKSRAAKGTLIKEVTDEADGVHPIAKEVAAETVAEPAKVEVAAPVAVASTPIETAFDKDSLFKELASELGVILKPMQESIQALQAENAQLKQALEVRLTKELTQVTPKLSLSELLNKQLHGTSEAVVDGRTQLAKSEPVQAKTSTPNFTGVPFINSIMAKQVAGQ